MASGVALHGDTTAHFGASSHATQWRNDGVAAASSDGGGALVVEGPRQF